jgi:hypothetical protein
MLFVVIALYKISCAIGEFYVVVRISHLEMFGTEIAIGDQCAAINPPVAMVCVKISVLNVNHILTDADFAANPQASSLLAAGRQGKTELGRQAQVPCPCRDHSQIASSR